MKLAAVAILLLASALFLIGCGGDTDPIPDAGSTSTSSSTGGCAGTAKAGEPCAEDCDCCGSACGTLTQADGGSVMICQSPCP